MKSWKKRNGEIVLECEFEENWKMEQDCRKEGDRQCLMYGRSKGGRGDFMVVICTLPTKSVIRTPASSNNACWSTLAPLRTRRDGR